MRATDPADTGYISLWIDTDTRLEHLDMLDAEYRGWRENTMGREHLSCNVYFSTTRRLEHLDMLDHDAEYRGGGRKTPWEENTFCVMFIVPPICFSHCEEASSI